MRKLNLQTKPGGRSWASEHKAALITCAGTILAAVIAGVVAVINHDPTKPTPKEPAVNVATPINNNNSNTNIIQMPPSQAAPTKAANLVLDQFTINPGDSLFERCTLKSRDCGVRWASREQWGPTEEWQAAVDLEGENAAAIRKELPENPEQKRAWLNYAENPERYRTRMNPVFDAVISNPGQETKVLTGIDVVVLHSAPRAQGDGEASGSSAVIPVLNRYTVELKGWKLENKRSPFTLSQATIPPIEIAPNRPARFQVALACEMGVQWDFQMRVRFSFGGGAKLQTDTFGLTC